MKRLIVLIFLLFFCILAWSQTTFSGIVIDAKTKAPLAFASVQLLKTKKGATTDIDGKFIITSNEKDNEIKVSYLAYNTKTVKLTNNIIIIIELEHASSMLEDVVIDNRINPAHRIIDSFMKHREENNPYNYNTFKYNAYTKAGVKGEPYFWDVMDKADTMSREDSLKQLKKQEKALKNLKPDSVLSQKQKDKKHVKDSLNKIQDDKDSLSEMLIKNNYIMFTESYTQRLYKKNNKSKETVLGTKVSGIDNPNFSFNSGNFQPFGMYEDFITMIGTAYQSPLGAGTKKDYRLVLKDPIIKGNDTTYVISFRPKKGKNFKGLIGFIYINSNNWALQNIIAQPYKDSGKLITFKLTQQYAIADGHWFPDQLSTTITKKSSENDKAMLTWENKSYFKNIKINAPIANNEFDDVVVDYANGAGEVNDSIWKKYRTDTLDDKAKNTLKAYTLLPPEAKMILNTIPKVLEIFALGAIPWGKVDVPFDELIALNKYERLRLGFGVRTNYKFSEKFILAGNVAYGFRDKSLKYGASVAYQFSKKYSTKLTVSYKQDIEEPGNIPYFRNNDFFAGNKSFRKFLARRMDSVQEYKLAFTTKPLPNLQLDAWLSRQDRNEGRSNYMFKQDEMVDACERFINTEVGLGIKYTIGETYSKLGRAKIIKKHPTTQLLLSLSKGLPGFLDGNLDYNKIAFQFDHRYRTRKFGETKLQVWGGQVFGNVPYSYLFNTLAAHSRSGFNDIAYVPNHFQTVDLYEFVSDRVVHFTWQQDFGSLFFTTKSLTFKPEFSIVNNISYGWLKNRQVHENLKIKTIEDGLFESGILVKNIYRKVVADLIYYGIGIGGFYRYGPNGFKRVEDNIALKIVFNVSF